MKRAAVLLVLCSGCTNDVPFFTDVPDKKRPVAVIAPVVIAETGGTITSFDPFVAYEASGEASTDADGEVVAWRWNVITKPAGSGIAIEEIDGVEDQRRIVFHPDLVGEYVLELVVEDDNGLESDPAIYMFEVTVGSGLLLELTWDRDYTDVDLHLVAESAPGAAFYEEPWDCYFQNKNPDWGVAGATEDDPLLPADIDDGYGPEIIGLRAPPPGTYRVWSHYYCDDGFGGTDATVKLFVDGALLAETTMNLVHTGDLWEVAALAIASDGSPTLVVTTGGLGETTHGCE